MSESPDRAGRWEHRREEERPAPASADGPGGEGALPTLGEVMGQVARSLQEEHSDVESTLQAITEAAVRSVPGSDECGITLVVQGRLVESRTPTGDLPKQIDQLQERLGEEPCLDAVWEHKTVRIEDIGGEDRWPAFAAEASGTGMRSMLSFQLFVTGDNLGALNLYARAPRAFDEESESIGLVFASHAAIALAGAEKEQNLRAAVDSRDLIGEAKGILMERFKITADEAFRTLVGASSRTNRKLLDIADQLCATGALPKPNAGRGRHTAS